MFINNSGVSRIILFIFVPLSEFLRIFQVGYKPEHARVCEWNYVDNYQDCSVYFENSVIAQLIGDGQHLGCKYFGVVSHALQHKVNTCRRGPRVNMSRWDKDVAEARLFSSGTSDIFGFLQYQPHDPVRYFLSVHPTLPFYFREVTDRIGAEWNIRGEVFQHVFYGNHFVARPQIYEHYVREFLNPAMKVMDEMPELLQDSGYPYPLPSNLRERFGVGWYPLHAFIAERLFSYWAHIHNKELIVKYY